MMEHKSVIEVRNTFELSKNGSRVAVAGLGDGNQLSWSDR
jgi:hypothetical protein